MGTVVLYGSVSVDGVIADGNDAPGPLFRLVDQRGRRVGRQRRCSQVSYDHTRPYREPIGVTIDASAT